MVSLRSKFTLCAILLFKLASAVNLKIDAWHIVLRALFTFPLFKSKTRNCDYATTCLIDNKSGKKVQYLSGTGGWKCNVNSTVGRYYYFVAAI